MYICHGIQITIEACYSYSFHISVIKVIKSYTNAIKTAENNPNERAVSIIFSLGIFCK